MDTPQPAIKTEIIPYIFYRDVPAALDWLAHAFGFTEEMRHPTPSGMHAQMRLAGRRIMMGQGSTDWRMQSPGETKVATMGVFIYLAGTRITSGRALRARRSFRRRMTSPTDAPTPRVILTAIPGSSPRPWAEDRIEASSAVWPKKSGAEFRR